MFPLQTNAGALQACFGEFHAAVTAGKKPGQKVLTNCLAECHATNEIAGVQFLESPQHETCLISPLFVDGADKSALLHMAVSPAYATLLETAQKQRDRMDFRSRKHWHNDHFIFLDEVSQMNDPEKMLSDSQHVALSILKYSGDPMAMVCGPISTGPGTIKDNLYRFNRTVMEVGKHMPVFNQLPFEGVFQHVHELLNTTHAHLLEIEDGDSEKVQKEKRSLFFMERFYKRVIKKAHKQWEPYFMRKWEESFGARTEHELFKLLGFTPHYLKGDGFLN